mgnify:CR=1 FL=1
MAIQLPIAPFLAGGGALLDVRTPTEFAQGHIPGARNLPLFSDAERAEVGTLYKRQGRRAAVLHGLALVGPRMEAIGAELMARSADAPGAPLRLTCWRGGLRSASVMESLIEDGTADMVSLSRPFVREPALVNQLAAGQAKVTCVSCNACFNPEGLLCRYAGPALP